MSSWSSHLRATQLVGYRSPNEDFRDKFHTFWSKLQTMNINDNVVKFDTSKDSYTIHGNNLQKVFELTTNKYLKDQKKLPPPQLKMNEIYNDTVCVPYSDKVDFVICQSMMHFWVFFDRNNLGDSIDTLLHRNKAMSELTQTSKSNKKWDILRRSKMIHASCIGVDGFQPDEDEGCWVPDIRVKGDCGVDVVRHIVMVLQEKYNIDSSFGTKNKNQAIKYIRQELIKNPPPLNERENGEKMTTYTEDDQREHPNDEKYPVFLTDNEIRHLLKHFLKDQVNTDDVTILDINSIFETPKVGVDTISFKFSNDYIRTFLTDYEDFAGDDATYKNLNTYLNTPNIEFPAQPPVKTKSNPIPIPNDERMRKAATAKPEPALGPEYYTTAVRGAPPLPDEPMAPHSSDSEEKEAVTINESYFDDKIIKFEDCDNEDLHFISEKEIKDMTPYELFVVWYETKSKEWSESELYKKEVQYLVENKRKLEEDATNIVSGKFEKFVAFFNTLSPRGNLMNFFKSGIEN